MAKRNLMSTLVVLISILVVAVMGGMSPHRMSLINYDAITVKSPSATTSLSVFPSTITDGQRVYVSYSLDIKPENKSSVYIAAYSPSSVDVKKTAPIAYKFLTDISGKTPFDMVNMREDYIFVLFEGGLSAPVEIARSNLVNFRNTNQPRGSRLMVTQNPSEMMISWSSKRDDLHPTVHYWLCDQENSSNAQVAMGISKTYSKSDMCGSPATGKGYRDPGFIHTAIMTHLQSNQDYCYIYGSDDEMSSIKKFHMPTTAAAASSASASAHSYPFSLIVYGDEGQGSEDGTTLEEDFPNALATSKLTWNLLQQDLTIQGVLHFGDVSYARGYAADWDIYMNMMQNILSSVPYAVSVGNHEADYPNTTTFQNGTDSGGECGIAVQMQFPTPQPALNKPWYWFKIGPIFVIQMSTEHDFRQGSEQYEYLQDVLLNMINRQETPWVIFTGHRPLYIDSTNNNPNSGDLTVANELQKHIEPLLMNAGGKPVDLTLWGHHHSYQRMCASFAGKCMQRSKPNSDGIATYSAPDYPVTLVVGTAGPNPSMNIQLPSPEYTEVVRFAHGVAQVKVFNETAMYVAFYEDRITQKRDEFWLLK
jgi:hypothetical protein